MLLHVCSVHFDTMRAADMLYNNDVAFRVLNALGIRTDLQPHDVVNSYLIDKLKVASIVLQLRHYFNTHTSGDSESLLLSLSLPAPCDKETEEEEKDLDASATPSVVSHSELEEEAEAEEKQGEEDEKEEDEEEEEEQQQAACEVLKVIDAVSLADRRRQQIVEEMRLQAIAQCRKDTLVQLYARRASVIERMSLRQRTSGFFQIFLYRNRKEPNDKNRLTETRFILTFFWNFLSKFSIFLNFEKNLHLLLK